MEKQSTIYFTKADDNTDEITAWDSVKMTWHFFALSVRKISAIINSIVHEYSWIVLFMVLLVSIFASSVFIGLARAERDSACKKQCELEQQVETLKCQLEVCQ